MSRRSLFSAVLPFSSGRDTLAPQLEKSRAEQVATVSSANACVERHGVVCRRCVEACERSAIRILAREGLGAVIDDAACTGCGDCIPVCPVEAIALAPRDRIELVSELANMVVHNG
ncbi:4Fe-4S dicluster domain-containing protein [Bradyrhizobium sp. CCBAU 51627]|uniref:4Fe-4S dicluster domain-containing protein n=1 Tax=Bradyrhizobium sp. CCBAU 51627 TaxID=1325088 RepID=UPI002305A0E9|nr:4Fe-4S dicluster domain-containing protein [Bradyrhizobium sp. CCBAU 51627]